MAGKAATKAPAKAPAKATTKPAAEATAKKAPDAMTTRTVKAKSTAAKAKSTTAKAKSTTAKATGKTTGKATGKATGKTAGKAPARSQAASALGQTAGKRLVIVESPAKARTVGQILGSRYVVTASQGHVRDLPKGKMGVDLEQDFAPSYVTMRDKMSLVKELKRAGDEAADIYLATDPDREGEAISWHLQTAAGWDKQAKPPKRVVFHEITKDAVEEAFQHPREIDMQLVNAQQARRILDRLVGYQISPLLGKRVQRGLSAGRVQSVALRLVTDRERDILDFVPVESWTLDALLHQESDPADRPELFSATLHSVKGSRNRLNIGVEAEARKYEAELKNAVYSVADVRKREVRQRPTAPFTTSTLQQEAGRKLRFTAQRTMAVAQQLYEGLPVGSEGSVGLITYMRTDSVQVSQTAVQEAREYITAEYGKAYLPDKPRVHRTRAKSAQEAHEAIRPTSIKRDPASLKPHLTADQHRLYNIIWARMLASQMADALSDSTTVNIDAACPSDATATAAAASKSNPNPNSSAGSGRVFNFRATGSVLKFPGFRTLYLESRDEGDAEENRKSLPELAPGNPLNCQQLEASQHFTQPPPRFTEATLIKSMEEKGIGRPSTYAPTIGVLLARNYVSKVQTSLHPTELGTTVSDLLTRFFADVMNLDFTARMEEKLDEVSQGEREWVPMLREFYTPFAKELESANENMPRVKPEDEATDEVCENCESPMVIKAGRFGRFIACTGYPKCRTTRPLKSAAADQDSLPGDVETDEVCDQCGKPMVIKTGRYGKFMACTGYPQCKATRPMKTGSICPNCGGDLVERRARGRGRSFYGCSKYPDCDFIINKRPAAGPCPECNGLVVHEGPDGVACTVCQWKGSESDINTDVSAGANAGTNTEAGAGVDDGAAKEPQLATIGD